MCNVVMGRVGIGIMGDGESKVWAGVSGRLLRPSAEAGMAEGEAGSEESGMVISVVRE